MITIRSENGPFGEFYLPSVAAQEMLGELRSATSSSSSRNPVDCLSTGSCKDAHPKPNCQADTPTTCVAEGAVGLGSSHPVSSMTVPVLLLSPMRILTDVLELGTRKQPACGGKEK